MTTQELADTVQAAAAAADAGWRAWSTGSDEIAAIGFARAERHYTAAGMVNLARDMADARQRCERRAEYQAMLDYARNYGAE